MFQIPLFSALVSTKGRPRTDKPWQDAKTVGPPLIQYFRNKAGDGENFSEWIAILRILNKSWYLEATSHIRKVTANGEAFEQLSKSLMGSLAHVSDLVVEEIGFSSLAFDEDAGSMCMDTDTSIYYVLNSAANIRTLSLTYVPEHTHEDMFLIPLNTLKTLTLFGAGSLSMVSKCPNLETLIVQNSISTGSNFICNPHLRHLDIITVLKKDKIRLDACNIGAILRKINPSPIHQSLLHDLGRLTKLTELKLNFGCAQWVNDFPTICETFKCLVDLRRLSVVVAGTPEEGMEIGSKRGLLNTLTPSLQELELLGVLSWTDNSLLMESTTLGSLEKLILGDGVGTLGYAELEWLTRMPNLVELSLWGLHCRGRGFSWFRKLSNLVRVTLNVRQMTLEAMDQLCWVGDKVEHITIACPVVIGKPWPDFLPVMRKLHYRGVTLVTQTQGIGIQ